MSAVGEIVPGVFRKPRKEDYYEIVRGLRPFVGEEELMLRSSLLLMRDMAVATKPRSCESAWKVLDIIECEANAVVFRPAKIEDLREIRRLCGQCVLMAQAFDRIYQPKTPEAA